MQKQIPFSISGICCVKETHEQFHKFIVYFSVFFISSLNGLNWNRNANMLLIIDIQCKRESNIKNVLQSIENAIFPSS